MHVSNLIFLGRHCTSLILSFIVSIARNNTVNSFCQQAASGDVIISAAGYLGAIAPLDPPATIRVHRCKGATIRYNPPHDYPIGSFFVLLLL